MASFLQNEWITFGYLIIRREGWLSEANLLISGEVGIVRQLQTLKKNMEAK